MDAIISKNNPNLNLRGIVGFEAFLNKSIIFPYVIWMTLFLLALKFFFV
jgi:hypothetical protein